MTRFVELRNQEEYKAAEKVVAGLEKKVKAGTATEEDIERYRDGQDFILMYIWGEQGKYEKTQLANGIPYSKLYPGPTSNKPPKRSSPVYPVRGTIAERSAPTRDPRASVAHLRRPTKKVTAGDSKNRESSGGVVAYLDKAEP